MRHIMVDLETMDNTATAAIIAIGAVAFDPSSGTLGNEPFYRVVNLESAIAAGGTVSASTILWWLEQSDEARRAIYAPERQISIGGALRDFTQWCERVAPPDDVLLWGNGAAFDNVILAHAYRCLNMPTPWRFWNDRCYRTVKNMYPQIPMSRVGTHHNAGNDAESQARHLMSFGVFLG